MLLDGLITTAIGLVILEDTKLGITADILAVIAAKNLGIRLDDFSLVPVRHIGMTTLAALSAFDFVSSATHNAYICTSFRVSSQQPFLLLY